MARPDWLVKLRISCAIYLQTAREKMAPGLHPWQVKKIPSAMRNKVEMTDTLNERCHALVSRKITLPKKLIISLNFCTNE